MMSAFPYRKGLPLQSLAPPDQEKSTLTSLMARFWDVDSGTVKLGGTDIREYQLDSLMANFSMVFQTVYLFNDTIEKQY